MDIALIRKVEPPVRVSGKSVGIDFFMPEINQSLINDTVKVNTEKGIQVYFNSNVLGVRDCLEIKPQGRVIIPSGVLVDIPEDKSLEIHDLGLAFIGMNKSGISTKLGLGLLAGVIDIDFTGEVGIVLYNTGVTSSYLLPGKTIAQFILFYVSLEKVNIIDKDLIHKTKITKRGSKGFGEMSKTVEK